MTRGWTRRVFATALLTTMLPLAAQAQDAAAMARAFGARYSMEDISLSPDGARVAMVVPGKNRETVLLIAEPLKGGDPASIMRSSGEGDHLRTCNWATDTRLICRVEVELRHAGAVEAFSRLVSVDVDGKNFKIVTARANDRSLFGSRYGGDVVDLTGDSKGNILLLRTYVPETSIGRLVQKDAYGLGVERVNLSTLERRPTVRPRRDAVEYITDGVGTIRIMGVRPIAGTGYSSNVINYFYRRAEATEWEPLSKRELVGATWKGFNPYAVDPKLNVAYGFEDAGGRRGLWRIALDGSMKRELVLSHPQVDVDGLMRIGRQQRVVGGSFATDKRTAVFFDKELHALSEALSKALPNQPAVSFIDASTDENTLLLYTHSDIDPGRYYVFQKVTKRLTEIAPARPELATMKLAPMKAVSFPAADGTMIPGYLTLPVGRDGKNLPAIVMPHGGPSARDEWGFDWLVQFFAARGYAVLQPNFRGSAGYGSEWFRNNGFQSWRTAIGDVNDAGRWLVKQGIADASRLGIVGWSYGGYAALQSQVLDPDLYRAVVAIAPVTDMVSLKDQWLNNRYYPQIAAMIGSGPHLREGSPAQNAAAIKAPVLLFHGDLDLNVGIEASRLMQSRLRSAGKPVQLIEYPGVAHSLGDGSVRADMLEKADAFLRTSMKM
jgi:dipeptidyl aminopeptidase/acylaminoacyl peptidase